MNNPAAPSSGICASLRQTTGYQTENFKRPNGRGIKPSSAVGGLNLYPPCMGLSAFGGLVRLWRVHSPQESLSAGELYMPALNKIFNYPGAFNRFAHGDEMTGPGDGGQFKIGN